MISVDEALSRIVAAVAPMPTEVVSVADAVGRVLGKDVAARRTQPPVAVSAMDGYAVRGADVAAAPVELRQIGEAPAGAAFDGTVGPGQTVRIFTGGPLPDGADTIVIQENTKADGDAITVLEGAECGQYVRPAGLDFRTGDVGLTAGTVLGARDVGLAASMNHPWLDVRRRPRVAILATGDEVVMPGEPMGANQIASSNELAVAALVRVCGGEPIALGVAPDDADSLEAMTEGARGADVLVTTGGVSVGDRDLVHQVLERRGLELDFWRIAMRPGKPLMFGKLGETTVLGLPGNPVSAMVCGLIFLRAALAAMLCLSPPPARDGRARLAAPLGDNDRRQDYLRARLFSGDDGVPCAEAFATQDSSNLSRLVRADCLIVRPPHAPAAAAGEWVDILRFPPALGGI